MDLEAIFKSFKESSEKICEHVITELRHIRTGQVTPSLIEDIEISAYGGTIMRLKEVASIATEGPSTLLVQPFDASIIQDIERALQGSSLGLSAHVDGKIIRISTPPLTEEQRHKFARLAGEKAEEGKVKIRWERDEARKHIKALFDVKAIGEDDKFRAEKDIDTTTKLYTDRIDDLKKRKQDEIMSI